MAASMSVGLFVYLYFLCAVQVIRGSYTPVKVEIKSEIDGKPMRVFSAEDIAKYDASDPDLPIYMGMRGVVFDVTSGKGFYSKESDYNILVGKDATRAHALWSLEPKDMTHDLSGLSDSELESVDQIFQGTYLAKYPIVGYMDHLIAQQPEEVASKFTTKVKVETEEEPKVKVKDEM